MREEARLEEGQIVVSIYEAEWSRIRRRWRSRYTIEFRTKLTWLDANEEPLNAAMAGDGGEFVYELAAGTGDPVFAHTEVRVDASRAVRYDTLSRSRIGELVGAL